MFIEYGIQGTTTRMITEKAGVSNGSLFHHFSNKDEILIGIYKSIYDKFLQTIYLVVKDETSVEKFVYSFFKSNIMWALDNEKEFIFTKMFRHFPIVQECDNYIDEEIFQYFSNAFTKFIDDGELVAINYEAFFFNITGVCDGVIFYIRKNKDTNIDWFIDKSFDQFTKSIY